ncbi:hypothetical protein [Methylorubrum suomiense]|uniref:Uncharacterized protein n=1 Tax=Methylorubrum suomiense TaxID=144191 RepID=A0ABQ4UU02_9HYPH|nr:hypothetical protein [Methylorubrum suomiense]GJE74859.1 hypothetical protein BGCPKDLD_1432 [Methylorubrum suomiense]
MGTQLEQALVDLFPPQGDSGVFNVKFFRGRNREVTAEQLAEQLLSANTQVTEGRAVRVTNVDGDLAV